MSVSFTGQQQVRIVRSDEELPALLGDAMLAAQQNSGYPLTRMGDTAEGLLDSLARDSPYVRWVAFVAGHPVGHVSVGSANPRAVAHIAPAGIRVVELGRLFVHPAAAGHGLGRALLRNVYEWTATHSKAGELCLITLPFLTDAIRLYRRDGWFHVASFNGTDGINWVFHYRGDRTVRVDNAVSDTSRRSAPLPM